MPSRNVVLHFGYDKLLSEARIVVLEDAGYQVIAVDTPSTALRVLRTKPVGLVVACHSVPPDELASVLQQMKVVGGLIQPQRSLADGFIDGLRGPEHLVSRVTASIARDNRTAVAS